MFKKFIDGIIVISILLTTRYGFTEDKKMEKATFAGGCFWCIVGPFEQMPGIIKVVSGYSGGTKENPTYEEVSAGITGHMEAIQITYDPSRISYSTLLETFWQNIDPTDENGQFTDKGMQYHTAIFYHDEEQKRLAEESKEKLSRSEKFKKPIATKIIRASKFYPAEDYHQDYYKKNPVRYELYRAGSGRDAFLKKTWPVKQGASEEELRKKLTPRQYQVTQECGTEPSFNNEYWDNKREGIYVDRISGEALFSSKDKFESGTGWPSFTKPLEPENVVEKEDKSLSIKRTEVKSKTAGSHLGHVFPDGPPSTGLRYCINSAALRFIPKEDLVKEGYGKYKKLFEK